MSWIDELPNPLKERVRNYDSLDCITGDPDGVEDLISDLVRLNPEYKDFFFHHLSDLENNQSANSNYSYLQSREIEPNDRLFERVVDLYEQFRVFPYQDMHDYSRGNTTIGLFRDDKFVGAYSFDSDVPQNTDSVRYLISQVLQLNRSFRAGMQVQKFLIILLKLKLILCGS